MTDMKSIAKRCQALRRKLKIKQRVVAYETGYSEKTVSAFECGKVNNARLLLWYIEHGLTLSDKGVIPWQNHAKE